MITPQKYGEVAQLVKVLAVKPHDLSSSAMMKAEHQLLQVGLWLPHAHMQPVVHRHTRARTHTHTHTMKN